MRDNSYSGYDDADFVDPYAYGHRPAAHFMAGQTYVESLDAASQSEWEQARDPNTGELLFHGDGTPVVFRKTLAQQMAPKIKRKLGILTWIASIGLTLALAWVLLIAFLVYAPEGISTFVMTSVLPVFANVVVWTGGLAILWCVLYAIIRVVLYAISGPLK